MQAQPLQGTILLAHGSRDPLWRLPVEAVARQVRATAPAVQVRCAYLELTQPDLLGAAAELAALGVTSITVLPLFMGIGKHARDDVPRLLAQAQTLHPHIAFKLRPPIGEDLQVIELLARIAVS